MSEKWLAQIHNAFVSLESAKAWINRCVDIDEIKQIRRAALAYERDVIEAAILKIYAERRLGQILSEIELDEGGRPTLTKPVTNCDRFSLKDIGLTKNESSAFQTLAVMPEEELDGWLAKYQQGNRTPKARGIAKRWKELQRQPTSASSLSLSMDDELGNWTNSLSMLTQSVSAGDISPFGCVYADPPWSYDNRGTRGAAVRHYVTMSIEELLELPVEKLVADQSLLWLWVTNAFLEVSFQIIRQWGFEFKSTLIWDKEIMGIGNYVRNQHEILMIASRGGQLTLTTKERSVMRKKRKAHSAKPKAIREVVERNSPGSRLELFGRTRSPGWTVFGNEDRTLQDHAQTEWKLV